MAASELADMWSEQKKASEQILMDWVEENPQWWAIGIATLVQTSMEVGSGVVDVLRFGEGAAEGGVAGYGKDALRMLSLLGPLGRAGGIANRALAPLVQSGRLRLAVRVKGVTGPCTFQAVNNAMSLTRGKQLFVTVRDMAKARGKPFASLVMKGDKVKLAAWIDDLLPAIRAAGGRVREVKGLTTVDQVVALARTETSPVLFAIRTTVKLSNGTTRQIRHSVIATKVPGGAVHFADYGGKTFSSLKLLVQRWGQPTGTIDLYQKGMSAVVLNGAQITGELSGTLAAGAVVVLEGLSLIETQENGAEFALPVSHAATSAPFVDDPASVEVVKGSLHAYKARVAKSPIIRLPETYITAGKNTAPNVSLLTGVQFRLNALGFGAGPIDGLFGPRSKRAVQKFQESYPPLKCDGIPGPQTQSKLAEICGY